MKKSNMVTLLFLCCTIVAVLLFTVLGGKTSAGSGTEANNSLAAPNDRILASEEISEETSEDTSAPETRGDSEASTPITETQETETEIITAQPNSDISMEDALFIGDSRTVGLMDYADMDGADFFCTVGMNVYNIHKDPVSVPNIGKVFLTELLDSKKYGKIYVMLGINELGYPMNGIVSKYSELIELLKEKQSDSIIIIQANLHVTKKRSDSDKVYNNEAIDTLNAKLSDFADNKSIYYLDANVLFDDVNNSLSADKAGDSAHPYAKYYTEWGEWIMKETATQIMEG